jgi:hypothetical protein
MELAAFCQVRKSTILAMYDRYTSLVALLESKEAAKSLYRG